MQHPGVTQQRVSSFHRLYRWVQTFEHRRPLLVGIVVCVLAGALTTGLHELSTQIRYADLVAAVSATDASRIWLALAATAMSYVALTGYDVSALRYVGAKVPYPLVGLTSFIAYSLGNTIGFGMLTGGVVRMRMYAAAGVESGQIVRAIAFNGAAFGLGIASVGAVALMWGAQAVGDSLGLPASLLQGVSLVLLLGLAGLGWLCATRRDVVIAGRYPVALPHASLLVRQLLISALDIGAAAAVLWCLLPPGTISFPVLAAYYAIATALGVLSHIPGGLGVFEVVMMLALGGHAPPQVLAAALLLYRAMYYLLPLALALLTLAAYELRAGAAAPIGRAVAHLLPIFIAGFTLVMGVMLLISGVTPNTREASSLLSQHVPLPLLEASHFIGSLSGLALLFVARGMLMRLDAAWWAGLLIAVVGAVLSLLKGLAVLEMAMLLLLAASLIVSRKQFMRRASLFSRAMSMSWLVSVGAIVVVMVGVLFFVYRDVPYSHQLWWQIEFDRDAPRSLRASLAVAVCTLLLALSQLFRPAGKTLPPPTEQELRHAARIIDNQDATEACLALMGDKRLLFSPSGQSFLMFGQQGRSWVALADPVGPRHEAPELVWRFLEMVREHGGRPAFYEVRPENLHMYLDAGLRAYKLGECAGVPLDAFSLKGSAKAGLRNGVNRAEREGLTFEVIAQDALPEAMPALKAVSDAWLQSHETAEKRFSLGAFDPAYILRQPVAVVRQEGRIVAFATFMCTGQKTEASVDLMRQMPDAPAGTMDFLFIQLMLYFKEQGYQFFNLGMAPLSGMAHHRLASRWHRVGRLLFAHGEHFYNFQGLRSFKEKFDPAWEARYLIAPGGWAPIVTLFDTAVLIGGGMKGVFAK